MKQNKLLIGLTGGSGCGKTTVAKILEKYGGFIIDADEISHNIIKNGQKAYFEIIEYFGKEILDFENNINRKILGEIVFSNKNKLVILEKITHKYILKEIEKLINFAQKKAKYKFIVLDAPLLIQTNLYKIVDTVWLVYIPYEEQIKRLIKRDNIPKNTIKNRLSNQMPFEKMKLFANFIIENKENIQLEQIILKQLNEEYK